MFKWKKIRTADIEMLDETAKVARGKNKSCSYEDVFGSKNQNGLDKTAGDDSPTLSWSDFKKTIFTPEEIAAADAKVASASGMGWDEYEKTHYTPEDIASSDLRVAKMCKKIEAKRKRKQFWSRVFRTEGENSGQR